MRSQKSTNLTIMFINILIQISKKNCEGITQYFQFHLTQ